VLSQSRHSITDIGLRNLVRRMIDRWEQESKYGECDVKYYAQAKLGERACLVIECFHPHPRQQFRFQISRLFIDKETNLPVRVENYGFPSRAGEKPPLIEEYTYTNVRTNVGLTDRDFDPKNPAYQF
jgi:outer membrane lipoprotein-sorting protein